jgi:riboflavin synthase
VTHTARVTTIGNQKVGDEVNIEVDVVGKYVEKFVRAMQSNTSDGVDADFLAKHGFI